MVLYMASYPIPELGIFFYVNLRRECKMAKR